MLLYCLFLHWNEIVPLLHFTVTLHTINKYNKITDRCKNTSSLICAHWNTRKNNVVKNCFAIDDAYDQLSESIGRIRRSGRLAVHCLRPPQDCDGARGHGHCELKKLKNAEWWHQHQMHDGRRNFTQRFHNDKAGKVGLNECVWATGATNLYSFIGKRITGQLTTNLLEINYVRILHILLWCMIK